jgi:predicted enzyme related to lactoylglutathione lyase
MSNLVRFGLGACAALTATLSFGAEVTLNSARVGGPDVEVLGKFYQAAFGLKEVNRLAFPGGAELFFNFGDSVDAAKANTSAQIVIMHTDGSNAKDPVAHLIFNVTDAAKTAAAVKAAGGTMDGDPKPFGNTGIVIGFAIDPAGNRIELLQRPQQR